MQWTTKKILVLCLAIVLVVGLASGLTTYFLTKRNVESIGNSNNLELFQTLTSMTDKNMYDWQKGKFYQFPENVKESASDIAAASDANGYYGLTVNGYRNTYDSFSANSEFLSDVQSTAKEADNIMRMFESTGMIDLLKGQGKKPAMMFDIDNTLEFTSRKDDDPNGEGPPIAATVDFVKKWRNKGIECYFITARNCNKTEAAATRKWLKVTFNIPDSELEKYVYLMGDVKYSNVPADTKIAYKDVVRHALSDRDGVFWLMSVGDQLTDIVGEHSGVRILIPNLQFDAAIVPNHYDNPSNSRKQVIEPSRDCYLQLKGKILEDTTLQYGMQTQ